MEAELYVPFDRQMFLHPTNYWTRYLRPQNMTQEQWDYATEPVVWFRVKLNNGIRVPASWTTDNCGR